MQLEVASSPRAPIGSHPSGFRTWTRPFAISCLTGTRVLLASLRGGDAAAKHGGGTFSFLALAPPAWVSEMPPGSDRAARDSCLAAFFAPVVASPKGDNKAQVYNIANSSKT